MQNSREWTSVVIVVVIGMIALLMVGVAWWYDDNKDNTLSISNTDNVTVNQAQNVNMNTVTVPIESVFESKIVYGTSLSDDALERVRVDCIRRNGTFNECGSICGPGSAICATVCAYTCQLSADPIVEANIESVALLVHAPYSTASVVIYDTGVVRYDDVSEIGGQSTIDYSTVTETQLTDLILLIEGSDFFQLEERYVDTNLMDATGYTVTVTRGGTETAIYCYGECPLDVVSIREKVLELWGGEVLNFGV